MKCAHFLPAPIQSNHITVKMATGRVIVTVGTTRFDSLVEAVTTPDVLRVLKKKGYTTLTCQIGNGSFVPKDGTQEGVTISHFRFSDTILDVFKTADLIISHAGAGTCLEVLDLEKPLLVVINDALMGNHQTELAEQLKEEGCAYLCTPPTLLETLKGMDVRKLKKFSRGDPQNIVNAINDFIFVK